MRRQKRGFTLLEVLVAALLLGMLVTILTMVFNQSSVAWRTGTAGVADLDEKRQNIATWHTEADAAIPRVNGTQKYRIVSPWDEGGKVRKRSVEKTATQNLPGGVDFDRPQTWQGISVPGSGKSRKFSSFVVGVTSAGPDRDFNKGADNITTWPKDIKK